MRKLRPRRPSAAFVVSMIALFAVLGGTAYAVGRNSVGTNQLKNGAVTAKKIKNGAVKTNKLKNGAVTTSKLSDGAVTAQKLNTTGVTVPSALHANGADSATNAASAVSAANATNAGTASALASVSYAVSASIPSPACGPTLPCAAPSDTFGSQACPAGTVVIGGGVQTSQGGLAINESKPLTPAGATTPTEWDVFVDNFTTSAGSFKVFAICIKANAVDNPGGAVKAQAKGR